jgi:hypothetical protein
MYHQATEDHRRQNEVKVYHPCIMLLWSEDHRRPKEVKSVSSLYHPSVV